MLPKHPREVNSSFRIPSLSNPTVFLLPSAIIFFLLLTHCSSPTYADDDDPLYRIFGEINSGNYTCNSTYKSNLNLLIPSLSSAAFVSNGFSKATFGVAPDQVFGLVLCRGDINATLCHSCLDVASDDLVQLCPLYKRAITWYDLCLLRYSNSDFLSSANNSPEITLWNINNQRFAGWDPNNESNKNFFTSVISTLLSNITDWALNNSTNRFATGEMDISDEFPTLYGLVQCTPDLSDEQCHECLQDLTNQMIMDFDGRKGGQILGPRCNLRYGVDRFYYGEPAMKISLSAAATPSGGKSKLWIIITAPSLALLLLFSLLGFLWIKRKRRAREKEKQHQRETLDIKTDEASRLWKKEESSSEFPLYSFSQIDNATDHFSHQNKLGEGGFGPVYKGQLPEGLEIAAKRLSTRSGQGQLEFKNEIQLIAKLQHRNLVSLIGCCTEGEEKILIYEYMPNKSLDIFLFDQTRGALLDWSKRFHIIEGIAQGLLYLHKHSRLRIIHRDLKASNILLDRDMNPKISDFGMARIFGSNEVQTNTNRVVGTYGYMSPECAFEGLFSIKSDIFSFGVLLLEIVSGKRNSTFQEYDNYLNLLSYAWELWKEGKWIELIDASLGERYNKAEIERSINVALMCVQENAVDRPTISNVIAMLSSEDRNLPNPKQPGFFNLRIAVEVEDTLDSEGVNV